MKLSIAHNHKGQKFLSINRNRISIGREPDNDIVLEDPEISRHHAEISAESSPPVIRDLQSRNGTFVAGEKIESKELVIGDKINIGNFEIIVTETGKKSLTELKKIVHQEIFKKTDWSQADFTKVGEVEFSNKTKQVIRDIIREKTLEIPDSVTIEQFTKEVSDEMLGLGPLEELIADPEITEIMVNGKDRIYVERRGKLHRHPKTFSSNQQVYALIEKIIAPLGRRIDESTPMVDARLKDGSRVNAIIPPLSITGPIVTIRKFSTELLSVNDLIKTDSLTKEMAQFLKAAVACKCNILVSGGTGTGKTTLLNILSGFIPENERIITIEDTAELRLAQEHLVRLEAKPQNIEGRGEISIRDLVRNALRMRPDRIIVGESRGGEALDMLQAMNTGHEGSMTTVHANSCMSSISRLEVMVLMAGIDLPSHAIREQIISALHLIIQLGRLADGQRKVMRIAEITGNNDHLPVLQDIFIFDGNSEKFKAKGYIPQFLREIPEKRRGIDFAVFKES